MGAGLRDARLGAAAHRAALVVLMLIATLLVGVERAWQPLPAIEATPFTVFGIALSLFLGFRNNVS